MIFKKKREDRRSFLEKYKEYIGTLKQWEEVTASFILSASVSDYAAANNKNLSEFQLLGVDGNSTGFYEQLRETLNWKYHVDASNDELGYPRAALIEAKRELYKRAKDLGAEVVVDIKSSVESGGFGRYRRVYLLGTALVPKNKENLEA